MTKAAAFTLVEVAACLLIAGLVAAAATLSLGGVNANARMDDVVAEIEQYQWRAREHAVRFGRAQQLVFDLDKGTVGIVGDDEAAGAAISTPPLQLAAGFEFASLRTAEVTLTGGRLALPLSTRGWTPTLAVAIRGPQDQTRWLLVAGLTGRVAEFEDERDVERVFAVLEPQSDDAG